LFHAAKCGYKQITWLLINAGASINSLDSTKQILIFDTINTKISKATQVKAQTFVKIHKMLTDKHLYIPSLLSQCCTVIKHKIKQHTDQKNFSNSVNTLKLPENLQQCLNSIDT